MPVGMVVSAPAPFVRLGPAAAASPIVIAVPHAGRFYPAAVETLRAVSRSVLEQLEDRYADRLIGPAMEDGAVAIVATHARAWIDLNRGREDDGVGTAAPSARAQAGLGLVPTRLGGRPLWRAPPDAAEMEARHRAVHAPYHAAVATALADAQNRYGLALLVDCHSMPPLGRGVAGGARIVVGDLHGASAAAEAGMAAVDAAMARGFSAVRNRPYAGAHTLAVHGRPARGIHAIQVETDRSLYLDADLREPGRDLAIAAHLFAALCRAALGALALPASLAAE